MLPTSSTQKQFSHHGSEDIVQRDGRDDNATQSFGAWHFSQPKPLNTSWGHVNYLCSVYRMDPLLPSTVVFSGSKKSHNIQRKQCFA